MATGDPKRQPAYRFAELTPDEFESLVFRLAWIDDRQVVRLRAPDGGLDTVLPDVNRNSRAAHGWQAKRHSNKIDVDDCRRSLDRAVDVWDPPSVTFVFPHDLSMSEHAAFERTVGRRHDGVSVDYWGEAALLARLSTREGKRVAAAFFSEQDAVEIAERMLRAGSPLRTGEDFLDAENAIADGLASADPDYDWIVSRGDAATIGQPEPTAGSVLRLSFARDDIIVHADLVPRHGSPARRPGAAIRLDDSEEGLRAKEWLESLMRGGGRLTLKEGATVHLSDVPAPFGDLIGDGVVSGGEIVIKAVAAPVALYAAVSVGDADDRASINVDLLPVEAPPEWDAVLQGHVGGLVVSLSFRWQVERGVGESRIRFAYKSSGAPHDIEARVLRWLIAVHKEGSILIEDRAGDRPSIRQATSRSELPSWVPLWAQLHEDLLVIEQAAGGSLPRIPEEITIGDVEVIATIARVLRTRSQSGMLHDASLTFEAGAPPPEIKQVVQDMTTQRTMVANVFGVGVPVAYERTRLPPMIIVERVRTRGGEWSLRLVPLGGDSVEVVTEIVPLSEAETS